MPSDCPSLDELRTRNAELMEENARLVEAIASRDAFLAIAAHELRNPMTPIIGRVSLLRHIVGKPDCSADKIEKSLGDIEWLISRYIQRATTLLDISRVNTGNLKLDPALVNVCALIREIAESARPLAEHAGSTLDLQLRPEGLTIFVDRLSLEQIIDNLISNAVKYGGGTPILITATADFENDAAVICVRDNCPGIAPADQSRIFERFERAVRPGEQVTGFGVGLWIVRQLTVAMGGTITVHSEPGVGSAFTITMPLQLAKDTK